MASEAIISFIEDDPDMDEFVAEGFERLLAYLANWAAFADIFPERA